MDFALNSSIKNTNTGNAGSTGIKPFMDFLISLREDIPIPILRDLAVLVTDSKTWDKKPGFLKKKIDRVYCRLCCLQKELGGLDLKKAPSGVSSCSELEDYVFSRIDFSRYREIPEEDFENIFIAGIQDFPGSFFVNNFKLGGSSGGGCIEEIRSLINKCYEKTGGKYRLQKESPLILSVMRTLEISLENSPLFTIEEIQGELNYLQTLVGRSAKMPETATLFSLLISGLENVSVTHKDETVTKLFISPQGELSATFRPDNKPWTRVLVPAGR